MPSRKWYQKFSIKIYLYWLKIYRKKNSLISMIQTTKLVYLILEKFFSETEAKKKFKYNKIKNLDKYIFHPK